MLFRSHPPLRRRVLSLSSPSPQMRGPVTVPTLPLDGGSCHCPHPLLRCGVLSLSPRSPQMRGPVTVPTLPSDQGPGTVPTLPSDGGSCHCPHAPLRRGDSDMKRPFTRGEALPAHQLALGTGGPAGHCSPTSKESLKVKQSVRPCSSVNN